MHHTCEHTRDHAYKDNEDDMKELKQMYTYLKGLQKVNVYNFDISEKRLPGNVIPFVRKSRKMMINCKSAPNAVRVLYIQMYTYTLVGKCEDKVVRFNVGIFVKLTKKRSEHFVATIISIQRMGDHHRVTVNITQTKRIRDKLVYFIMMWINGNPMYKSSSVVFCNPLM